MSAIDLYGKTLNEYLALAASKSPTPGGGSVSAVTDRSSANASVESIGLTSPYADDDLVRHAGDDRTRTGNGTSVDANLIGTSRFDNANRAVGDLDFHRTADRSPSAARSDGSERQVV